LHDLPFAYRMSGLGISFDAQIRLTVGDDGFRQALMAGTGETQVYVLRTSGGGALAQMHYLPDVHYARLAYVAPALAEGASEALWLAMLDGMTAVAGARGMVTIIAEVSDDIPEFELLRRAGYAVYARQDLWVRSPAPAPSPSFQLRAARNAEDQQALLSLYGSLVPGLIKHVEPPPTVADQCFLVDGKRGSEGLVAVYEGANGVLLETYLLPNSLRTSTELLTAALNIVNAVGKAVYCRVRDYMGSQSNTLSDAGFQHLGPQAVMYRHTAARITQSTYRLVEKVDGGVPLPSSIVDGHQSGTA
jgi:hypothetical protein